MNTKTVQLEVGDADINGEDASALIEPVWWTGNIYEGVDRYDRSLERFSAQQRFLFAIQWYVAEVNNGGHDQFFFNSTGIVWPDALAGLAAIGADTFANILREATDRFGTAPPRDREQRIAILERLSLGFDDLDDRFYNEQRVFDLNRAMLAYARKNRAAFHFSGEIQVPETWQPTD